MKTAQKMVIILVAATLLFTVFQESASAEEKKMNFKVDGVTCLSIAYTAEAIPTIAYTAEAIPTKLDGVQSSKYDFAEDGVTVVFDDAKVSIEELMTTFEKENFPVVGEPVVLE
jgi:copper chaperone CopZ